MASNVKVDLTFGLLSFNLSSDKYGALTILCNLDQAVCLQVIFQQPWHRSFNAIISLSIDIVVTLYPKAEN